MDIDEAKQLLLQGLSFDQIVWFLQKNDPQMNKRKLIQTLKSLSYSEKEIEVFLKQSDSIQLTHRLQHISKAKEIFEQCYNEENIQILDQYIRDLVKSRMIRVKYLKYLDLIIKDQQLALIIISKFSENQLNKVRLNSVGPIAKEIQKRFVKHKSEENGRVSYSLQFTSLKAYSTIIKAFPKYRNEQVYQTIHSSSDFKYEKHHNPEIKLKQPVILQSGEVYYGEWNLFDQRHGRGMLVDQKQVVKEGSWVNNQLEGICRVIFTNNSLYIGCLKGDKFQGQGKFYFEDGKVYQGQWKKGLFHGQGILTLPNGRIYKGDWKEDLFHGYGIFEDKNGRQYIGEWVNGQREGKGKFIWENGSFYDGEWADGKYNGFGTFQGLFGEKYVGNWINDLAEGKGTQYYKDGSIYEGYWFNGKKDGIGTQKWPNGEMYEGEWKNDLKCGFGVMTYQNQERYEGEWSNDTMNGQGIFYWPNGKRWEGIWCNGESVDDGQYIKMNGESYRGELISDRGGWGSYIYPSGDKYKGQWKGGKKEGWGVFKWANGNRYIGEFKNDLMHGKGVFTTKGGESIKDNWYEGKQVGSGKPIQLYDYDFNTQQENGQPRQVKISKRCRCSLI